MKRALVFGLAPFSSLMLAAAAVVSCRSIAEPTLFPNTALAMQPAKAYALWWQLTQACAGVSREFGGIQWFYVPNADSIRVGDKAYNGVWFASDRIVLAEGSLQDGPLVRHEMLHALVGSGHDHRYFVDACGGVVSCADACAKEAGPPADPRSGAPEILPSDLALSLAVTPSAPSIVRDSGWIALTVGIENPRGGDVWVQLEPTEPGSEKSATFGYVITCVADCSGGASESNYVSGSRLGLSRSSGSQFIFDRRLEPGTYSVRGTFNTDTTAAILVKVGT